MYDETEGELLPVKEEEYPEFASVVNVLNDEVPSEDCLRGAGDGAGREGVRDEGLTW